MQRPVRSNDAWQPETPPDDENEVTHPFRIISSRTPHPSSPTLRRRSWFKKQEEPGVRQTPDFTEIGDPADPAA